MPIHPSSSSQPVQVHGTEVAGDEPREWSREKLARLALDSIGQFVGLLDPQGTVLEINQAPLDAAGITLAEVVGRPFWTTCWWQASEVSYAALRAAIGRAAAGELVRWDTEILRRAGDSETVALEASLRPILDEQGEVQFLCIEGRDLTERKACEREIARQREELAQLDRLKTQFLANLSDELRTPLTLMLGPLEETLVAPEGLSVVNRSRLELARSNALRQLQFLDHLHHLSGDPVSRNEGGPDERFTMPLQEPPAVPPSPEPTGERILLADLHRDMREYVQGLLTGYVVETVANGDAALDAARQRPPDLVLADVMLPGLDGFELLRELRADPGTREVPVILISAQAGEGARLTGLEAGADDYLVKPFSARELRARVQAHLRLSRLRRESRTTMGKQNERLKLLWEAAGVLLTTTEPDAMLRGVFAEIRELLDLDCYFSFMVTESGDGLRLVSCAGISEEAARSISWLEFGQTVAGTVARQRKSIVVEHVQESSDPIMHVVQEYDLRAYACNPLLAGGELLGTLSFGSRSRDRFEPEEVEFLETISQYVTVAYERMRLVQQLQEQDRRKDEFLATLAHELRNPLAPIRNGLELIRLGGNNPATLEQSRGMIERQILQMVRLVDDLLDVSRISRDKLELRRERVELAAVIHAAVETSRPLIEAAAHELQLSLPPGPVLLDADPVRLAQAFSNLLNNAAKYTGRGGCITIRAEWEEDEVAVTVQDSGIGIPTDQLPDVFNLFVQLGRSRGDAQGGLGIGLTLVRRLAEMHGGSVSAYSAGPGQGSEFTLRLPAISAPAPPALRAGPVPEEQAGEGEQAAVPAHRVLIVDDNRDAADSLAEILEYFGYEVAIAYDGLQAVEKAPAFQPRVVLMDLGMPGLNGYEAARRIRELPECEGMLLVALTGWGQEEDKRRSREAGFDLHLVKPVDLAALEQLLAAL